MWANESVFYQIFPLGLCGAPYENDGKPEHRLLHVLDFIPHLKKLGINAIYFSPLFESDTHGYNTRDYNRIDVRLGDNNDMKKVCETLHKEGFHIILDGVFNHVGRGFAQFQDVIKNREASPYKDWFYISFDGNSNYNDGLWYEGWEGNYDLVKLNLKNPEVQNHLMNAVYNWIQDYDIDGLRLDVAYMVDPDFLRRLRHDTANWKEDFFLVGETLFGDYNRIMNDEMCHSVTNYECYKGIHSSFNSHNMFEINHSLMRQFGPDQWCLYRGKHLFSFVDNHDVSRIISTIENVKQVPLAYLFIFTMPGIPIVYYGSEWGEPGDKRDGDPALRPYFPEPEWNGLTDLIQRLAEIFKQEKALQYGTFRSVALTNQACAYARELDGDKIIVCINESSVNQTLNFNEGNEAVNLLTGKEFSLSNGITLQPYQGVILKA